MPCVSGHAILDQSFAAVCCNDRDAAKRGFCWGCGNGYFHEKGNRPLAVFVTPKVVVLGNPYKKAANNLPNFYFSEKLDCVSYHLRTVIKNSHPVSGMTENNCSS